MKRTGVYSALFFFWSVDGARPPALSRTVRERAFLCRTTGAAQGSAEGTAAAIHPFANHGRSPDLRKGVLRSQTPRA